MTDGRSPVRARHGRAILPDRRAVGRFWSQFNLDEHSVLGLQALASAYDVHFYDALLTALNLRGVRSHSEDGRVTPRLISTRCRPLQLLADARAADVDTGVTL